MADKNSVIIQETYCTNIGSFYWDASRQLEEAMQKYLSILEDIRKDAIVAGDTADSLQVFIQYAKKIKGQIEVMGKVAHQIECQFMDAVDEADQYLF